MKRSLLLYGAASALIMILMKALEYRYFLRKLDLEIYISLVSIICLSVGVWLGIQLVGYTQRPSSFSLGQPSTKLEEILSSRESEVLVLMAAGYSNQEIADQLHISIHTVKTHTTNLFAKLSVKRRTQAVIRAREMGLLTQNEHHA